MINLHFLMKRAVLVLFVAGSCLCCLGQTEGTMTDAAGQSYKTIIFDIPLVGGVSVKREWMAENLNYEVPSSFCYSNEPAYCEVYGRLYTFEAAKEACPEGWRLPTVKDWEFLTSKYGGMNEASPALRKDGESGMNLLLGGFGDPGDVFRQIGISGNYWDSENRSANTAGLITISQTQDVFHGVIGNYHRNSVRCIKEY